jgi:hypothetical protein
LPAARRKRAKELDAEYARDEHLFKNAPPLPPQPPQGTFGTQQQIREFTYEWLLENRQIDCTNLTCGVVRYIS